MHAQNVSHRDLKPGNLLLVADGRSVEAFLIALDGAAIRRHVSRKKRLKNLSRLAVGVADDANIGRTSRLRFLKPYLEETGEPWKNWKLLWRELETLSDRRDSIKRSRSGRRGGRIRPAYAKNPVNRPAIRAA